LLVLLRYQQRHQQLLLIGLLVSLCVAARPPFSVLVLATLSYLMWGKNASLQMVRAGIYSHRFLAKSEIV
jgi:hypothetical protein